MTIRGRVAQPGRALYRNCNQMFSHDNTWAVRITGTSIANPDDGGSNPPSPFMTGKKEINE